MMFPVLIMENSIVIPKQSVFVIVPVIIGVHGKKYYNFVVQPVCGSI
ncbi:hypothetical protein BLA29_014202 [Euroglyphus maynei]|uniref:Uncharacterized protein n=1 Tax=Euroglyphus maynei TaxID=6958 RepID=A0A1Y3B393_EURMA|nr:hypothetical protein BLA29_014202 [Euroglyphus maynei]